MPQKSALGSTLIPISSFYDPYGWRFGRTETYFCLNKRIWTYPPVRLLRWLIYWGGGSGASRESREYFFLSVSLSKREDKEMAEKHCESSRAATRRIFSPVCDWPRYFRAISRRACSLGSPSGESEEYIVNEIGRVSSLSDKRTHIATTDRESQIQANSLLPGRKQPVTFSRLLRILCFVCV